MSNGWPIFIFALFLSSPFLTSFSSFTRYIVNQFNSIPELISGSKMPFLVHSCHSSSFSWILAPKAYISHHARVSARMWRNSLAGSGPLTLPLSGLIYARWSKVALFFCLWRTRQKIPEEGYQCHAYVSFPFLKATQQFLLLSMVHVVLCLPFFIRVNRMPTVGDRRSHTLTLSLFF